MPESPSKFGELLTEGIRRIQIRAPNKTIAIIQDELGYAVGRKGGSAVEWWRGGRIPLDPAIVEKLAREIVRRSDVDRRWLEDFLSSADYPNPTTLCDELFPPQTAKIPFPSPNKPPGKTYGKLVGRDQLIEEVLTALLSPDDYWMVAIDGMGGIGKSAIAVEVAHRCWSEGLFDRVIWISAVRGAESGTLTFEEVLNTIGVELSASPEIIKRQSHEKMIQVQSLLGNQRVLVILDNLETAGEPQDQLVRQLRALFDHSKALLTSRHRFGDDLYVLHLIGLDDDGAKNFIYQEATKRRIDRVNKAAHKDLQQIIEATGGSPLALKLVVGQLGHLPLETVLNHLRNVQPLRDNYDEDEYVRLFKFIFFPSWNLLQEDGKKLLLVMAHFPPEIGGKREAIKAISHLIDSALDRSIDALWRLSFLEVSDESLGVEQVRYYLHALTRYFVRSEIAQVPT